MRALIAFIVAAQVMVAGCVDTVTRGDIQPLTSKLAKDRSVLIATAQDGSYENQNYPGSGKQTAMALRAAFARHVSVVSVVSMCDQLKCLGSIDKSSNAYLVVPEILHWEDRATEWSAIPDRVEIKVSIFNVADSTLMASTIISGKSKTFAWVPGHPQDLIAEPINAYINSLY